MYNFIYIPVDHSTNVGFGYAFINFTTSGGARFFREHFSGFAEWTSHESNEKMEVVWSQAHQGIQEHVDRLRNSPVMHESVPDILKPALYVKGVRVPFPPPTKKPRAPRIRHQQQTNTVQ